MSGGGGAGASAHKNVSVKPLLLLVSVLPFNHVLNDLLYAPESPLWTFFHIYTDCQRTESALIGYIKVYSGAFIRALVAALS